MWALDGGARVGCRGRGIPVSRIPDPGRERAWPFPRLGRGTVALEESPDRGAETGPDSVRPRREWAADNEPSGGARMGVAPRRLTEQGG